MHRVAYVLSEGFQILALSTQAVFEFANDVLGENFYRISVHSPAGGPVRSSAGLVVETRALNGRVEADTWLVNGVLDPLAQPAPEALLRFLRKAAGRARRTAAVCTGAFILAEAGLLEGRRATTHWHFARELQARHPGVRVEEDRIYIVDGPILTSAGMTAGLDLALAMVEKDLGSDVACSVAHMLVMHQHAPAGRPSIRRCWTSRPGPIASRTPSTTSGAIWDGPSRWRPWPGRRT